MIQSLKLVGILFIAMIAMMFIYNLLKLYVFSKFKPFKGLKWIMAGITVISIFSDSFLNVKFGFWSWQYILGMGVFMLCLVATFDLFGWGANRRNSKASKNSKDKEIVIRPKAKPNRVKKKSN